MSNNSIQEEISSSDNSEEEEDAGDGNASSHHRSKRSARWCGSSNRQRNTASNSFQGNQGSTPHITWPPDPATVNSYGWRSQLRQIPRWGNPLYGTKMQLYSRTNFNLAVYPDGCVRGTQDDDDLHTHLELITAGSAGHVRIQGILTKLYVAMDKKGRLYAEPDIMEEGTIFIENVFGLYKSYLSKKFAHLGWYLGIKKSGKFKNGSKTRFNQKAVLFLSRRSKFE